MTTTPAPVRDTHQSMPTDVADYLRLHHVITLSTSSFTGLPHADTAVYASDDRRLYFFAVEGSSLHRNVSDSRYVSFTIDDYTTDWRKVRELQGVCGCRPADDVTRDRMMPLWYAKFGHGTGVPLGILHTLDPSEMHFVDYDYALVAGQVTREASSRNYVLGDEQQPMSAPVATTLDSTVFEPGSVIFRPGDQAGQYYVVVEGEVEIRAEGFGSDQTVTRVGPGQMFGDQAALYGQRGGLTAHAVTRAVLLGVQREAMRDLLMP